MSISKKSWRMLEVFFKEYCEQHEHIYCKALKRKISLGKLPEAILYRKDSATARMKCFWVALDTLKKEKCFKSREIHGNIEYEIVWLDNEWKEVRIHLRQETTQKKDKIIFFISCY